MKSQNERKLKKRLIPTKVNLTILLAIILKSTNVNVFTICEIYGNTISNQGKLLNTIVFIELSAACLKLQSLCREFQNQNKKMKAEQLRLAKDEEDRRKQLIEKFQGSLENITKQLGISQIMS